MTSGGLIPPRPVSNTSHTPVIWCFNKILLLLYTTRSSVSPYPKGDCAQGSPGSSHLPGRMKRHWIPGSERRPWSTKHIHPHLPFSWDLSGHGEALELVTHSSDPRCSQRCPSLLGRRDALWSLLPQGTKRCARQQWCWQICQRKKMVAAQPFLLKSSLH